MIKTLLVSVLLVCAIAFVRTSAFGELIPARRLTSYTVGTNMGVSGGINQYRPGGVNDRTNIINVTTGGYTADPTGVADSTTTIQAAINAATAGTTVYFPTGIYKISNTLSTGSKKNITLRGAGDYTLSRSPQTIGTGTKTFTVAAGLGYQTGDAVKAMVWDRYIQKITSITNAGGVATAILPHPHGYATGQTVEILGATQAEYNSGHTITVVDAYTFTYPITGSPVTATGSHIYTTGGTNGAITSITRSGATATVTTAYPHFLGSGQTMHITGSTETAYNGEKSTLGGSPITVTGANTFTFTVAGTPANDSNGALRWCDGVPNGALFFMRGTVTSYVGTTLTLNITTMRGEGSLFGMWRLSVTALDQVGAVKSLLIGVDNNAQFSSGANLDSLAWVYDVTGSPVAGDAAVTVSDASAISNNDLVQVTLKNNYNAAAGASGDNAMVIDPIGYEYKLRQMSRVVSKSGNTLTISPPLLFDLPVAKGPLLIYDSVYAEKVGVEDIMFLGHNTSAASGGNIEMYQTIDCWLYRVSIHSCVASFAGAVTSLRPELREVWASHKKVGVSPATGGVGYAFVTGGLIVDTLAHVYSNYPILANTNTGLAIVNCFTLGGDINTNHGSHPKFTLLEGNVGLSTMSDGYWGSQSEQTMLRNWFVGYKYYYTGAWQVRLARFNYQFSLVGNLLGTPGYNDGLMPWNGYPNMGNQTYEGTVNASIGTYWRQLGSTGSTINGTLTTRTSNTEATITIDSPHASADIRTPYRFDEALYYFWWGPEQSTDLRSGGNVSWGASTMTVSGGAGANFPTDTPPTPLKIWGGSAGYQEFDQDVIDLTILKGNTRAVGSGWGTQESLGGDTLPDSYAFASKPASFGSLTWPAINPASPDTSKGWAVIPMSYLFYYGEMPPAAESGYTPGRLRMLRR